MTPRMTMASLICLLVLAGVLPAQDASELHRKAEALSQNAEALADQGEDKLAEALRDQAHALHEKAELAARGDSERTDLDLQIEKHMAGLRSLQEKLEDLQRTGGKDESTALMKEELATEMARLRAAVVELQARRKGVSHEPDLKRDIAQREAELHKLHAALHEIDSKLHSDAAAPMRRQIEDKIAHLERELDQFRLAAHEREVHEHAHKPPHDEVGARIEHMLAAAEHLDAAGMPDIAVELRQRAEEMQHELHHRQAGGDATHELRAQVEDLRHEVRRLQATLEDLQALIRSRSDR